MIYLEPVQTKQGVFHLPHTGEHGPDDIVRVWHLVREQPVDVAAWRHEGPKWNRRWFHQSGRWAVSHCGHPTANWPYVLHELREGGRDIIGPNGLAWQTVRHAQAMALLLEAGPVRERARVAGDPIIRCSYCCQGFRASTGCRLGARGQVIADHLQPLVCSRRCWQLLNDPPNRCAECGRGMASKRATYCCSTCRARACKTRQGIPHRQCGR